MEDYSFKQISRENLKDILSIFFESFGKKVDENYLLKKSTTAPIGKDFICFAAYHNESNKVVAFLALYPCLIHHKGQFVWAAQEGDGMVHPLHQGKGLFVELIKLTEEYATAAGIKVLFGFPNEKSCPAFTIKRNWELPHHLRSYVIRIRCFPWVRLRKWFGIPDRWFFKHSAIVMRFVPDGSVPFQNSASDPDYATVFRPAEYFWYKSFEKNYVKNLGGKILWLKPDPEFLKIGDMEKCNDKEFRRVLVRLRILGFFLGTHHIRFTCSPGVSTEKLFLRYGRKLETEYPVIAWGPACGFDLKLLKFTMCDNDTF